MAYSLSSLRRLVLTGITLLFSLFTIPALFTQNPGLSLEVYPAVTIPLGASQQEIFNLGFGGSLELGLGQPDGLLRGRAALGYTMNMTKADRGLNLIRLAIGPALNIRPSQVIRFELGLSGGAYLGIYEGAYEGSVYETDIAINPVASAEFRTAISFSPSFALGLGVGYDYYFTRSAGQIGDLWSGLRTFLGVNLRPGAASGPTNRRPRIQVDPPQFQPIFPVLLKAYDTMPLGTLVIRNNESGPIEDVRVSFFIPQHMESPRVSAPIPAMLRGAQTEVPLFALLRDSVLGITEPTLVNAQIVIEYRQGRDELRFETNESIRIYDRNAITWDDDRKAAAFITPRDPTVLRFSRNVASAVRNQGSTAVNTNLRIGKGMFQAMNLHGMQYVIDPQSSFIELSQNPLALDFVQFPQQTLDFRAGDCDDLTILFTALMEAAGIPAAFITTPGHIFAAFSLQMSEQEARATFASVNDLIFINGQTWVPVEVTLMGRDFLEAWSVGARQWREASQSGTVEFFTVQDAWTAFEPTGFASEALSINYPQDAQVIPSYLAVLNRFIERELAPQVEDLQTRIAQANNNPRLVNRLGVLYSRFGLYDRAIPVFQSIISRQDFGPALVNLGNIYFAQNNLSQAVGLFERALRLQPDDTVTLLNLARAQFELKLYDQARRNYQTASVLDPVSAERFSFIASASTDTARASAALDRSFILWKED
jgi:tetratricopeptide (TPR) repeat protein